MNRKLSIAYKSAAVARVIMIAAALVLGKMRSDSLPRTGLFANGIDITFDWWVEALVILMLCLFGITVLLQLLLALAPQVRAVVLPRRAMVRTLFVMEILITAFLFFIAINEVKHAFFAPPRTIIDSLLSPLFPVNEETLLIAKYEAVNYSLMALCNLFFVLYLWKVQEELADDRHSLADTETA
jgi:hypothetical protein